MCKSTVLLRFSPSSLDFPIFLSTGYSKSAIKQILLFWQRETTG